jgi:hypothetical protein
MRCTRRTSYLAAVFRWPRSTRKGSFRFDQSLSDSVFFAERKDDRFTVCIDCLRSWCEGCKVCTNWTPFEFPGALLFGLAFDLRIAVRELPVGALEIVHNGRACCPQCGISAQSTGAQYVKVRRSPVEQPDYGFVGCAVIRTARRCRVRSIQSTA